ncbi:MAG: hypothetical protein OES24_03715 [Acidimicrobiia bacterium]|nr:hypothetical protein [Acidimicrobiia bacterium]
MAIPRDAAPVLVALAAALVPAVSAWALWLWRWPDRGLRGGIALAALWNATWLLPANLLAVQNGFWHYNVDAPRLLALPMPLWFGWVVLWGVVAPLLPLRPAVVVGLVFLVDLVYMPLLEPVVELGPQWWLADLVMVGVVAIPGLFLARSTASRTSLTTKVVLQVLLFGCLLVWVIPAVAADLAGSDLRPWPPPTTWGAVTVALGLVALPGLTAVDEFRLAGGTPWPWDGTARLVGSGPYRYVRSPMQLSGIGVLVIMAIIHRLPIVLIAAVVSSLYGRLFCRLEEAELARRFGTEWLSRQAEIRRRLPSWRPSRTGETAVVWIDLGCQICRPVADFLLERDPTELTVRDAAEHPKPLSRARYERADGSVFDGVAAIGMTLEHLHLGWAMVGWLLRLPVLRSFWQLIGDAVGFGQRPVTGSTPAPPGTVGAPPDSTVGG